MTDHFQDCFDLMCGKKIGEGIHRMVFECKIRPGDKIAQCRVAVMNRKPTKQSRGPNSEEKAHMAWVKERCICAACGKPGPVIAHHCEGSTFKVRVGLERVMVGHWFILGLCSECDDIVTHGSRRAFRERFGDQCDLWLVQAESYPNEIPINVIQGIAQCQR